MRKTVITNIIICYVVCIGLLIYFLPNSDNSTFTPERLKKLDTLLKLSDSHLDKIEKDYKNRQIVLTQTKKIIDWAQEKSNAPRDRIENIVYQLFIQSDHPLLLLSIFEAESKFDPHAISSKGAVGLGQVHPVNFSMLKRKNVIRKRSDLFNIKTNIQASDIILVDFIKEQDGNLKEALKRYSAFDDYRYSEYVLSSYKEIKSMVNLEQLKTIFEVLKTKQFNNDSPSFSSI